MFRRRPWCWWVFGCFVLIAVSSVLAGPGVGRLLEEALKNRQTASLEDVVAEFQRTADLAKNPLQKASVLNLLAEHLMDKSEWERAVGTYQRILQEGAEPDRIGALYGLAQCRLYLGQEGKARELCSEIQHLQPENSAEEFATFMMKVAPGSVHARLAEFFAEGSAGTAVPTEAVRLEPASEDPLTPLPVLEVPPEASSTTAVRQPPAKGKSRLTVGATGWNSDVQGHIAAKGMALDLANGTDFGGQTRVALSGRWQFTDKDQMRADYSGFDQSGNLTRGVTFDKLAYTSGARLRLRTSFFDLGLSRLLDEAENGAWKFLYGVKFSRSFLRVSQQLATGLRAGELTQNFTVPYLGIEGNARLSAHLTLNGSMKYSALNRNGGAGRLTDIEMALLFGSDYVRDPAETEWYGSLGYRYLLLRGEVEGDTAETGYSGPTIGLEGRF